MNTTLIIWYLNTYEKGRGYNLSKKELIELVPYSDKIMRKKFKQWQKEQKRVDEC